MTLGYEEHLAALLRPLGVYDLQPGTINRGELAAYGRALDGAGEELDHTAREMSLTTARDFGLERIEALLPYRPVCQTARQRREALAAVYLLFCLWQFSAGAAEGDPQWMMVFVLPLMLRYNGERGPGLKWFFYWFYPAHTAALFLLARALL